MKKSSFALGLCAAALLSSAAAPAAAAAERQAPLKTVYGWAKKSGNSAMIVTPYRASRGEVGESGLKAWHLGKRAGDPIRIDYTEGLLFRQVNKKCGKAPAGHPYDTRSKGDLGAKTCDPIDLYNRLRKGRVPVKVVYDPAGPMAVKVYELILP
ncbi:hypothetical protein [Planomonospora venezuelensis]|uniref:Uncharacterized protein n=1 Tax=Planomonospora venezuelensis TaxID=1999 RepID=A0A841CXN2_PLAVE|nr:hypothetical protein [Planomonospora venezuelensis]MBB5961563.1 hypothetical protein [Planomonospora venezuelensis]GIM98709.1 hypothetical protein Pve01_03680 [Planomonospora venezuelensis]